MSDVVASEEVRHWGARLAKACDASPVDERGAVEAIAKLGSSCSLAAVPCLLPALVASTWALGVLGRRRAAARNLRLARNAAEAVAKLVGGRTTFDFGGLDRTVRLVSAYHGYSSEFWRRWFALKPSQVSSVVQATQGGAVALGVLVSHPNGYVREEAVILLEMFGGDGLPWLLIRANDWVDPIRTRARSGVSALMVERHAAAFVRCLPLIEGLHEVTRVDHSAFISEMFGFLRRHRTAVRDGLRSWDPRVRRASLRLLAAWDALEPGDLELALADSDLIVRVGAARHINALDDAAVPRLVEIIRRDPSATIRGIAMSLASEGRVPDAASILKEGLIDPSTSVRQICRYSLRESEDGEQNFSTYYRERLGPMDATPGTLGGLADVGDASDWELVVPHLDGSPKLARAAIRAMRALNDSESRDLRLLYVDDPRPGVSREAAWSLRYSVRDADVPTIKRYLTSNSQHVRRNALLLAAGTSGWTPALLLSGYDRDDLRERVQALFEHWLRRAWRSCPVPTAEVANLFTKRLPASQLTAAQRESARKLLKFKM